MSGEKGLLRKVMSEKQGACTAELLPIDYDIDAFLEDFAESGVDALGMTLSKAVKRAF